MTTSDIRNHLEGKPPKADLCFDWVRTAAHMAGSLFHCKAHLRRHVVKCASARDRPLLSGVNGQPKVCQLDGATLLRQQDILRLAVAPQQALHEDKVAHNLTLLHNTYSGCRWLACASLQSPK